MSIIKELAHIFFQKNLIKHSKIRKIFTKYGLFKAKVYKDGHQEHLVIMSRNLFDLNTSFVYIYSDVHACDPLDDEMCYCNNQMDLALKIIRRDGGIIVYSSGDVRVIDGLLQELKVRKLETKGDTMTNTKVDLGFKDYRREYQTLGFIFKDLDLTRVRLVTHDHNIMEVASILGIEIVDAASAITFDYGEEKTDKENK